MRNHPTSLLTTVKSTLTFVLANIVYAALLLLAIYLILYTKLLHFQSTIIYIPNYFRS